MSDPMSVAQVASESDCLLHLGAHYDEYTSGGWPSDEERRKSILAHPRRVVVGGGDAFHDVGLEDFLAALAPQLEPNSAAVERFAQLPKASPGEDVGEEGGAVGAGRSVPRSPASAGGPEDQACLISVPAEKVMWKGDPDFPLKLSTVYDTIRKVSLPAMRATGGSNLHGWP